MGGTTYAIDSRLDLDSHADMAVLGSNCIVFEETGRTIDVFSYDPKLGSTERKVVSGTFAYDDPDTGRVVLLIVHQGLHIPHLTYSLIPPFQMRENGVEDNETPNSNVLIQGEKITLLSLHKVMTNLIEFHYHFMGHQASSMPDNQQKQKSMMLNWQGLN
jgi:hypothetical protein